MFDDINKIIPKLDEKDSQTIYQNLSKKQIKSKPSFFANKFVLATASVVILIFIFIPVSLMLNNHKKNDGLQAGGAPTLNNSTPEAGFFPEDDNSSSYNDNLLLSDTSVIGIAAFNEFDKKEVNSLSNVKINLSNRHSTFTRLYETNGENNQGYLTASYPFDYVKILSAYKFTVQVPSIKDELSNKIIELNCGLGELEVVVADFETYVNDNGYMSLCIQDKLICLRGHNGYYTILVNNEAYTDESIFRVFSSHKRLTQDEVNKDLTPPILSVFLKTDGNSKHIYFETSNSTLSFGNYKQDFAFESVGGIESVSKSTLYSVLQLVSLPVKQVEATVTAIDYQNKTVTVQSQFELQLVRFNEYTEGAKIQDLTVGERIIVEYDFLFEKYDPVSVFANCVTVKTGGELQ